jgi:hypothetical protein
VITVCAECGRMRTVLFLDGDRWFCVGCRAEGATAPNYFPSNGTLPANTWIALFTTFTASTVGTNTSTRGDYSEPAGGAYARQTISSASWGAQAAATAGRKSTAAQVTYPTATAAWGTVNGFWLANSVTTGSVYFAANFDDTTAVNIQSNDVIKVTPTIQYNQ